MHSSPVEERETMLRITTEKKRGKLVLNVEGRLSGTSVGTLEQCWRELRGAEPEGKFHVNLCGVSFIDASGKVLLKEIHSQGGHLVAEGCLNQAILSEITAKAKEGREGEDKRGKGPNIIFYLALFGILASGNAVAAQESSSAKPAQPAQAASQPVDVNQPVKLTLEQAVNLALKQNPTAQIAILQAAQSQQDKNIALSALLPQVSADVQQQWQKVNLEAQFGGQIPFPNFPRAIGPYGVFSTGIGFNGPLFDLTLFRRYQAARQTALGSKADSISTREQVILLVVSQYIGSLRAVADVEASKSRVELAQALYDQAADIQKEGVGTGIDTLRSNVELQNEKQRLIQAQTSRDTSLFGLSRLLNLDPRQKIELGDSLGFFDTPQPEVEASIDAAVQGRQEWKSLDSQVKAAELNKKAAWSQRLPTISYNGTWNELGTEPSRVIPTYTYTGTLSVPLFTGGRIHAESVKADLELKKLAEQKADLRNSIALDVKTALLNLESARNEVQVANLGVQLAKEEVDQARDRFKA